VPDGSTLLLFAGASLALLVVPGPAVLFIVARSVEHGRSAGLVSMLGVQVGALVHVAAAVLGISALLVQSAVAFSVVKYAGAAYLVYLGVRRLLLRGAPAMTARGEPLALGRLFRQGIVVNVLNPKAALFFFAFLPQFVDPDAGAVALQMGLLGLLFVALAVVSDGLYAVAAGSAAGRLRRSSGFVSADRWLSGSVLVGLGVATAFSGSHRK
jgi:threonine/homoserine/homoserine lactone efflux protein